MGPQAPVGGGGPRPPLPKGQPGVATARHASLRTAVLGGGGRWSDFSPLPPAPSTILFIQNSFTKFSVRVDSLRRLASETRWRREESLGGDVSQRVVQLAGNPESLRKC